MARVLIALGSNVGDRAGHLQGAVEALAESISVEQVSSWYETVPMYLVDQPMFLNGALMATARVGPRELLAKLKSIEKQIGRETRQPNGPREVDLDLIAFGALSYVFSEKGHVQLTIPHPKLAERRFVLAPLAEIAPDATIPGLGVVRDLLEKTNDQAESVVRQGNAVLHV